VAMGMESSRYLSPGDVIECEVSSIGVLRNAVS
jgi:2-keto-4-pentenoate hydratase/2-oxohepta-3-ene-1,7-dioic acid hydratase in catechol pathway